MKKEDFQAFAEEQKTGFELLPIESRGTFNDYLMQIYKKQTGETIFRTFGQWKEQGFKVKKGESSFPLFSRPIHVIKAEKAAAKGESYEREGGKTFFGICHLFHFGQVEKIEV